MEHIGIFKLSEWNKSVKYSHAWLSSGEGANENIVPGPLMSIAYSFSPPGEKQLTHKILVLGPEHFSDNLGLTVWPSQSESGSEAEQCCQPRKIWIDQGEGTVYRETFQTKSAPFVQFMPKSQDLTKVAYLVLSSSYLPKNLLSCYHVMCI